MASNITPENIMQELNNIKNWKRTSKKSYDVYVCAPKLGTKVQNRLEGSSYVVNENKAFVLSGTVGEQWVIDGAKLAKTYCFMDGTPITKDAIDSKRESNGLLDWVHIKTLPGGGGINWAFHLPLGIKNFPVNTSWGDTLYANRDGVGHGVGDFILASDAGGQPNLNDVWVVNGEVFPTTYDMRAFPGLIPANKKVETTPVPKSLVTNSSKVNSVGEPDKVKQFMQALNNKLKENKHHIKIRQTSGDIWETELDELKDTKIAIIFENNKLNTGIIRVINEDKTYKVKIRSLDHAYETIVKEQDKIKAKERANIDKVFDADKSSKRVQYQIVGRYMDGSEVTGYHLQSIETGKSGRYTRGQVCFLVGRGQITNCTAQIYKDTVLLRGNGMSLEDLPIIREDGELRNTDSLGNIRKGTSAVDAINMFNIVGALKSGRNTVGYVLQNAGCGIKKVKRDQVIKLAQEGKIGNARVQNYNGKLILRGINCNLDELPSEDLDLVNDPSLKAFDRCYSRWEEYLGLFDKRVTHRAPGKCRVDFRTKRNSGLEMFIVDLGDKVRAKYFNKNNNTEAHQDFDGDILTATNGAFIWLGEIIHNS